MRSSFGINADDEYVVSIQANYPPRDLKFNIFYIMSTDPVTNTVIMFPIKSTPFTTVVKPILADFRTQIYGQDVNGIQLGSDMTVYVSLKDVNNYCYDTDTEE